MRTGSICRAGYYYDNTLIKINKWLYKNKKIASGINSKPGAYID
jgi:hypothetical protein